jgi:hypothetical protein
MEQDMSNENRGSAAWKSRLEDTALLAQTTNTDTNALWQKLYDRLEEKPRRKKVAAWYWVAAACLVGAMLLPFLYNNAIKKETGKTTAVKQLPATATAPKIANISNNLPGKNSDFIVEKRQSEKVVKKGAAILIAPHNNMPGPVIAITSPIVQNDIEPLPNTVIPGINATVVLATTAPVLKQKLKVVHINELGYPEEATHREEHLADDRSIRFNPVSPETYTSSSSAQNISGLNFFKTKTSPSN